MALASRVFLFILQLRRVFTIWLSGVDVMGGVGLFEEVGAFSLVRGCWGLTLDVEFVLVEGVVEVKEFDFMGSDINLAIWSLITSDRDRKFLASLVEEVFVVEEGRNIGII